MGQSQTKTVVLIAGPTASGKSAVAMAVAEGLKGIIINADAMQLYSELKVLTSRPSAADEAAYPHKLYGCVPAREVWSAGRWLQAANEEIKAAWDAGAVPVVVGGTGLYFKVLEQGLSPVPTVPDDIRERWRNRLVSDGAHALHAELKAVEPLEAERLNPGDSQRVVRALEVLEATGKPLSAHFSSARAQSVLAGATVRRVALLPPREELYGVIDVRFETMMARGALDEVKALLSLSLPRDVPAMKAIGVEALEAYLNERATLPDAVAMAQRQTRNYAKRQMTWIRNQMADWPRVERLETAKQVVLND